jgi:hypothetical protein
VSGSRVLVARILTDHLDIVGCQSKFQQTLTRNIRGVGESNMAVIVRLLIESSWTGSSIDSGARHATVGGRAPRSCALQRWECE